MPIATNLISKSNWILSRELNNIETNNSYLIDYFNNAVQTLIPKYNGVLVYYKYVKNKIHMSNDLLEYSESSPFARLFKISPNGYYLYNYLPNNLWNRQDIDNHILEKYLIHTNKYSQPTSLYNIQHKDYILFCLQSNASYLPHSFNLKGLFDIVKWANSNNKVVYFKIHPFTAADSHIFKIWQKLIDNGYINNQTVLVDKTYNLDHLIDNCKAVWTFSSGAGFQAILKNKPVAHFYQHTDYAPIATFANTPEEAYSAVRVSESDKLRYLSWYYHKLTIDVTNSNFIDRLDERFSQVFKKGMSIEEIF
jgi:hypothetical protein